MWDAVLDVNRLQCFCFGDLDIIFFVAPSSGSHPRSPIQGKSLPRLHHQDNAHKEPFDHPTKYCWRIGTCFSGYDSEWQGSRWRLVSEIFIHTDYKLLLWQDGYPSMRMMNFLHLYAECFTAYWWAARCVRMDLLLHANFNTNQFIGRNKSYLQLNIHFSAGVTTEATVINAFPRFLQP